MSRPPRKKLASEAARPTYRWAIYRLKGTPPPCSGTSRRPTRRRRSGRPSTNSESIRHSTSCFSRSEGPDRSPAPTKSASARARRAAIPAIPCPALSLSLFSIQTSSHGSPSAAFATIALPTFALRDPGRSARYSRAGSVRSWRIRHPPDRPDATGCRPDRLQLSTHLADGRTNCQDLG